MVENRCEGDKGTNNLPSPLPLFTIHARRQVMAQRTSAYLTPSTLFWSSPQEIGNHHGRRHQLKHRHTRQSKLPQILHCPWNSWPLKTQQKGQESPTCLPDTPTMRHEHLFEGSSSSPGYSTWTSNRPINSGIADTHMLDVIVCLATLHKRIHNCRTTLDGLDIDHRAVTMALNLTSIKFKVKPSINCGDIDWRKICEEDKQQKLYNKYLMEFTS